VVQPEFRTRAKEVGQPQGRIPGDGALPIQDAGDAVGRQVLASLNMATSTIASGPLVPAATLKSVGRFYSRAELLKQRQRWKRAGKTVVFTNGCYDLLHPGHIRLLEQARSLGDVLILALNSDASTRRAKGPARPVIAERERAELALALQAVDAVVLFDEDTPRDLIASVLPDVLVKGADWSHFVAGREEVEAAGGKVLTVALEPGYSTTNIVERLLSQL